jgi:RNA polymerase sigma factor (sigma-70 family)
MNGVLRHLRRAALLDGVGLTDGQLLEGFLTRHEEAAFEALVQRHGPMVLGVCRRLLRHEQDAEDAFQATFLVLVRKAATIRPRDLVGAWLHGVACRTAMKARTMNGRRRERERRASVKPTTEAPADETWEDLLPLLDEELNRLPDKYRVPVVLCELEGRTRREVARQLKVPEGTVSSRLATARNLLARRLARYGLAVSGGALAAALSERTASAGVTGGLAASTARVAVLAAAGETLAAGAVPARVVTLAEGVVKTMFLMKLRAVVAVGVVLVVSAGVVGLAYQTGAAEPRQPAAPGAAQAVADDLEALRLEVEALRKSLQATRERVKTLEDRVQALQGQGGGSPRPEGAGTGSPGEKPTPQTNNEAQPFYKYKATFEDQPLFKYTKTYEDVRRPTTTREGADDPLAEAEAALRKLREHPDDKQAADALENALKRLKEQKKPEAQPGNPAKKP